MISFLFFHFLIVVDETSDYYWTDGTERDYDHWYDFQPSNPKLNPCVYVDMATGLWLTVKCEQGHGYVCKKPSNLDMTTAEPTGKYIFLYHH